MDVLWSWKSYRRTGDRTYFATLYRETDILEWDTLQVKFDLKGKKGSSPGRHLKQIVKKANVTQASLETVSNWFN